MKYYTADRNVSPDWVCQSHPINSVEFLHDPIEAERVLCTLDPSLEAEIEAVFASDPDAWMDVMQTQDGKLFAILAVGQYGGPHTVYHIFTELPADLFSLSFERGR